MPSGDEEREQKRIKTGKGQEEPTTAPAEVASLIATEGTNSKNTADVADAEAGDSYDTALEQEDDPQDSVNTDTGDQKKVVLENTPNDKDNKEDSDRVREEKLLQDLSSRFQKSEAKMDYLRYEEMMDNGQALELLDEHRVEERSSFSTSPQDFRYGLPASFQSGKVTNNKDSTKNYWKGNGPVLEKADYNGETVMLPIVAPRDEPRVTIRKVILDRTVSTIENHQGGSKVNWFWKMNLLLKEAEESRIYVGAVNRIVPLDKPDRMDKDVKGDAHSHLAFRWKIFDGTE